jgi:hypothetical protein
MKKMILLMFVLIMAGCAEKLTMPLVSTGAPFDISAFKPYAAKGSGKISGQAFLKTAGGEVKVAAGDKIELWPATPYIKDIRTIKDSGAGVANLTHEIVAEMKPYIRDVIADAQGNFEFNDLPPGEYMLETYLTWKVPGRYGLYDTGGVISAFVTIAEGESKRVILTD